MAGVSPEIAAMFARKPRARPAPAPPMELGDLGPLEDRDPCADLEVERLLRELAASEQLVASLRGHQAAAERLAAELVAARAAKIDRLERALLGGARQVERAEELARVADGAARDFERRLVEALEQLRAAPKPSGLAGTWKGCAKILFQRVASLRAMNDRLRAARKTAIADRAERVRLRSGVYERASAAADADEQRAAQDEAIRVFLAARARRVEVEDLDDEERTAVLVEIEEARTARARAGRHRTDGRQRRRGGGSAMKLDDGLTREQRRSRRHRDVRAKTIHLRAISKTAIAEVRRWDPEASRRHLPISRAECIEGERPCPYVSCVHHLFLDVSIGGGIKLNFPDLMVDGEPDLAAMRETCSLDVADRGPVALEDVGEIMNFVRERTRQIEVRALEKARLALPVASEGEDLYPMTRPER